MFRFFVISSLFVAAAVFPAAAQSPDPALLAPPAARAGLAPPAPTIPGGHSGNGSHFMGGSRYVQVPGSARTVMIPSGTRFKTFHDRVAACSHYGAASGLHGGRLNTFTSSCAN
jgi:hypothetical protein